MLFPSYYSGQGLFPQPHFEYKQTTCEQASSQLLDHINAMGYYTTYYSIGFPAFLVVVIALYLLFTGSVLASSNPNAITNPTAQAQAKHSMSVAFSKKRVLSSGALSESVFVSV